MEDDVLVVGRGDSRTLDVRRMMMVSVCEKYGRGILLLLSSGGFEVELMTRYINVFFCCENAFTFAIKIL